MCIFSSSCLLLNLYAMAVFSFYIGLRGYEIIIFSPSFFLEPMSKSVMVVFPFIEGIFLGKLDAFWGQQGKIHFQSFRRDISKVL